jgi:IS30 family transposase
MAKQLTLAERYQIYALKKAGHSKTQIARQLGRACSTIKRELERNRGGCGYRPGQAQRKADDRKRQRVSCRIGPQSWELIESLLRQDWSPEQISGWLREHKRLRVSHERIYQHVYRDKARGGGLWRHLRCQKKRRKRYGRYDRRGQLPNRVSIDQRPAIVGAKRRLGDWELDTLIGKNHQQALVSMVERKSKYTLLAKVERNTAVAVGQALTQQLRPHVEKVKTLTADNGREFAQHQEIARQLDAAFYFAHPYHSWERGLNENTNGLVRQYFPKQSDFSKIRDIELRRVQERLNHRPRKTLNFRTPHQVFFKTNEIAFTT